MNNKYILYILLSCLFALSSCDDAPFDLSKYKVKSASEENEEIPVTSYTVPVATAAQAAALPSGMAYLYQVNGQTVTAAEYQAAAKNITSDTNFTIAVVDTATGVVVSSSSFVLKPMTADQAEAGQVPTIVNIVDGKRNEGYTIVIPTVTTNLTTGELVATEGQAVAVEVSFDGKEISLANTNESENESEKDDENTRTFTVTGNGKTVTFKMIKVEGGTFQMGSTTGDSDEQPVHSVTISKAYYMCETEVTQALWYAVMGQSPTSGGSSWSSSYGIGDNYPAYYISYEDCQSFLTALNSKLSSQLGSGEQFRFPTEAEWEFAAKGGNKSKGYTYAGSNTIDDVAWYNINNSGTTHLVKTKAANELGLYDMSGNVWEWCYDWYGDYTSSAQTNPTGPSTGSYRMNRGGSWYDYATYCRVASRHWHTPTNRYIDVGFRLAL